MGLLAWIRRLWARLRGYPRARKVTLHELISLIQSEVERGIDAGSRRTADGTVVEVTSVDIEVPLGLATNLGADEGIETDAVGGLTTTVGLDADPGGGDGRLTLRFRPRSEETTRPPDPHDPNDSSETSLETVETLGEDVVDDLEDASTRAVEDVADAGESAVAEATDAAEGDAKRVVDAATAASLGVSHDTAQVLADFRIGIDDLASMTPVELLSTIEDGLQSGAASVESTYEADVRELAAVIRNAEQAVEAASNDLPGDDPDGG